MGKAPVGHGWLRVGTEGLMGEKEEWEATILQGTHSRHPIYWSQWFSNSALSFSPPLMVDPRKFSLREVIHRRVKKKKNNPLVLENGKHTTHLTVIWVFCLPRLHQPTSWQIAPAILGVFMGSNLPPKLYGAMKPMMNLDLYDLSRCLGPDVYYLCIYR